MYLSTEIASAAQLVGEEKAVELIAKAGFTAWDFSMFAMARYDWSNNRLMETDHPLAGKDYLAFARRLKQIGLDNGIVCNQSHAPFPTRVPEVRAYYKRAIECTAEAGGKICIIHPDNEKCAAENAEMYQELLPFAKSCGVKIATENMWNWDGEKEQATSAACSHHTDFLAHLEAVNDPYLVACLDIGHAEMYGLDTSSVQMIETLGGHLQALHIHDNDCRHDSHRLPFTESVDFASVMQALKRCGYTGDLTLEADAYLQDYTAETVLEGITKMADCAKRLARMFHEG